MLTGLTAGSYTVNARKEAYDTECAIVHLPPNDLLMKNFVLNTEGKLVLHGRVVDENEQPVGGALVTDGTQTVAADQFGYYALGKYTAAEVLALTVSRPGYLPISQSVTMGSADTVKEFSLTRIMLTITVTGKGSGAVPDAIIRINNQQYTTDTTGKARIAAIPEGMHNMLVTGTGFSARASEVLIAGQVENTAALELEQGESCGIYGHISDDTGDRKAVNGALVRTVNGGDSLSDSFGNFAIAGLPASKYTLIAEKAGFNSDFGRVELAKNTSVARDFILAINEQNGGLTTSYIVSGRVLTATGAPLSDAVVSDGLKGVMTDSLGYYAIGHYQNGSINLTASKADFSSETNTITLDNANASSGFTLTAPTGGTTPSKVTVTLQFTAPGGMIVGTNYVTVTANTVITPADMTLPGNYRLKSTNFKHTATATETKTVEVLSKEFNLKLDPYISGYPDGNFRPQATLSRAEAAQLIYNLYGNGATPTAESFSDTTGNWADTAIRFCRERGYLTGIGNDKFEPNRTMTRAEFCAMESRIKGFSAATDSDFVDISGHWAKSYIDAMSLRGFVVGFDQGGVKYFRPNDNITRSESVTIINRVEDRPQTFTGERVFLDLVPEFWAFSSIMNAANGFFPS